MPGWHAARYCDYRRRGYRRRLHIYSYAGDDSYLIRRALRLSAAGDWPAAPECNAARFTLASQIARITSRAMRCFKEGHLLIDDSGA